MCQGRGMISPWTLPEAAELGGARYPHRTDFRDILEILALLGREDLRLPVRWFRALGKFYRDPIPYGVYREALGYLSEFLTMGQQWPDTGAPLLDWQTDAPEIAEGVSAVAGRDIRGCGHVHWWTFLGWFHSIGEGRLRTLVDLRQKLRSGKSLTEEERTFVRQNPQKFRPQESEADKAHRQALEQLLQK